MLPKNPKYRAGIQGGEKLSTSVKPQLLPPQKRGTKPQSQFEQDLALGALAADKMEWK